MLEGLPCVSRKTRAIASATWGSTGVVAAWSRYTRSMSESLGRVRGRSCRDTARSCTTAIIQEVWRCNRVMSDGWTFVFGAFLAILFGWCFVTFADDLFLIFIGDTTGAAGESQGFGRPVVWVVVRSR